MSDPAGNRAILTFIARYQVGGMQLGPIYTLVACDNCWGLYQVPYGVDWAHNGKIIVLDLGICPYCWRPGHNRALGPEMFARGDYVD